MSRTTAGASAETVASFHMKQGFPENHVSPLILRETTWIINGDYVDVGKMSQHPSPNVFICGSISAIAAQLSVVVNAAT